MANRNLAQKARETVEAIQKDVQKLREEERAHNEALLLGVENSHKRHKMSFDKLQQGVDDMREDQQSRQEKIALENFGQWILQPATEIRLMSEDRKHIKGDYQLALFNGNEEHT